MEDSGEVMMPDGLSSSAKAEKLMKDVESAELTVVDLQERSEEVTSVDEFDLSCLFPITRFNAVNIVRGMGEFAGLGEVIKEDLIHMEPKRLKDYVRAIVQTYRNAVFSALKQIGTTYQETNKFSLSIGKDRDTDMSAVMEAISQGGIPVIDLAKPEDVVRTFLQNSLVPIRRDTIVAWKPMFEADDHQAIADNYLLGKITTPDLLRIQTSLQPPVFRSEKNFWKGKL